jgi:hypothetical protein
MSKKIDLNKRHNEIRSALNFFLSQWYKHKQASTSVDSTQVLKDYISYRSLESVIQRIKVSHPQVHQSGSGRPK